MIVSKNFIKLKKNNHNLNICDNITITITNSKSTKLNKIGFVNYFLFFLNFTTQLGDNLFVKKKHQNADSFKISTKLKSSNAEKFLFFLSTYVLPNRQKFKKYNFENNSNIISFYLNDWINFIPNSKLIPNNLQNNQPSMQIVIALNKNNTSKEAFSFLSTYQFPVGFIEIN